MTEKMDKGWIQRGFLRATKDIEKWPQWMQREAGLSPSAEPSRQDSLHAQNKPRTVVLDSTQK